MGEILLAGGLWVVTHLGLSSAIVRPRLVGFLGEKGFLGVYSLVAAAALGYLIWVYSVVERLDYLWLPNPDLFWVAKILMPVAFILMVGGFMVKNPTMVGASLAEDEASSLAQGVTRITRHPFQWAVVLWAIAHLVANGDLVSWVFFISIALVSFIGSLHMDSKKAASFGAAWQNYAAVTSNVPLLAILQGRNRLDLKELLLPTLVGLGVYVLVYYFHDALTGTVII